MNCNSITKIEVSDMNINALLGVIKFTIRILLPRYSSSLSPLLATFYDIKRQRQKKTLKLKLWCVPEDAFLCLIPMEMIHSLAGSVNASILVSFNTFQSLGVRSCSWLKLHKFQDKSVISDASHSYLVHVIAVPDVEDSVAVVTSVLHYNITQALLLVNDTIEAEKLDEHELLVPNMATVARVSLLKPLCDVITVLDTVLSHYFQHPCYLRNGDVFCIDITKYAPAVTYQNSKLKTLYFKVLDIEGPCYSHTAHQNLNHGYYVIKGFTSLVQCTNQQGYVPYSDVTFVKGKQNCRGNNLKSQLLSTCPFGLDTFRDELLACIQPHVLSVNSFQLKPLFLLSGPRGVGKGDVISNVAERLGLNVFVVDSFELQGGLAGYTEGKFKQVFTKVLKFAPCIILLRNIEVCLLSQQPLHFL
jgi:hypothetical protein